MSLCPTAKQRRRPLEHNPFSSFFRGAPRPRGRRQASHVGHQDLPLDDVCGDRTDCTGCTWNHVVPETAGAVEKTIILNAAENGKVAFGFLRTRLFRLFGAL